MNVMLSIFVSLEAPKCFLIHVLRGIAALLLTIVPKNVECVRVCVTFINETSHRSIFSAFLSLPIMIWCHVDGGPSAGNNHY